MADDILHHGHRIAATNISNAKGTRLSEKPCLQASHWQKFVTICSVLLYCAILSTTLSRVYPFLVLNIVILRICCFIYHFVESGQQVVTFLLNSP